MERYLTTCERLSPQEYYVPPQAIRSNGASHQKLAVNSLRDSRMATLSWPSPIETVFAANNTARVDFFRRQEEARSLSRALVVMFVLAVLAVTVAVDFVLLSVVCVQSVPAFWAEVRRFSAS